MIEVFSSSFSARVARWDQVWCLILPNCAHFKLDAGSDTCHALCVYLRRRKHIAPKRGEAHPIESGNINLQPSTWLLRPLVLLQFR